MKFSACLSAFVAPNLVYPLYNHWKANMRRTCCCVQVDRNTVTIGTCDVNLSFGAHPAEIPGVVRFLHPLHNFALVAYDPAALPAEARSKISAAELLTHPPLTRGERCRLVGLTQALRIMQRSSTVTSATVALTIPSAEVPRWVSCVGTWSAESDGVHSLVCCCELVKNCNWYVEIVAMCVEYSKCAPPQQSVVQQSMVCGGHLLMTSIHDVHLDGGLSIMPRMKCHGQPPSNTH